MPLGCPTSCPYVSRRRLPSVGMRGLGSLGTSEYDRIVPGSQFVLSLGVSQAWYLGGGVFGAPGELEVTLALSQWAPITSGKIALRGVASGNNQLVLTFATGAGSDIFTYGGLASALADVLGSALGGWSFSVTGLNVVAPAGAAAIPGTGKTSTYKEFEELGGITLNPFASAVPGSGPSWASIALLGGAAILVYLIVKQ
jgi:hypothetical protein